MPEFVHAHANGDKGEIVRVSAAFAESAGLKVVVDSDATPVKKTAAKKTATAPRKRAAKKTAATAATSEGGSK